MTFSGHENLTSKYGRKLIVKTHLLEFPTPAPFAFPLVPCSLSLWKLESMYNPHSELNPHHIFEAFAKTLSVTTKTNRRTFSTCRDLSLSGVEMYTCLR